MDHPCAPADPSDFPEWMKGRYTPLGVLGTGGMGRVFLARDRQLTREVAIKFLRSETADPSAVERFLLESRALAAISDPHVVKIFDAGSVQDLPYLVMERIVGQSLATEMEAGPIPERRIRRHLHGVLRGLGAAHGIGMLHRDVKPSNVLIRDGTDEAVLIDFGLVLELARSPRLTSPDMRVGTPSYMAPELLEGRPSSEQSDLFSCALMAFRAWTGVDIHDRDGLEGDMERILSNLSSGLYLDLVQFHLRGRGNLGAVLLRALNPDPGIRFPSADAMIAAITRDGDSASLDGDRETVHPTGLTGSPRPPVEEGSVSMRPPAPGPGVCLRRWASLAIAVCGIGVLAVMAVAVRSSPANRSASSSNHPGTEEGKPYRQDPDLLSCLNELVDATRFLRSVGFEKEHREGEEVRILKDGARRLAMGLEHLAVHLASRSVSPTHHEWLGVVAVVWDATDELQWHGLLSGESRPVRAPGIEELARQARERWSQTVDALARGSAGSPVQTLIPGLVSHVPGGRTEGSLSSWSQDEVLARLTLQDASRLTTSGLEDPWIEWSLRMYLLVHATGHLRRCDTSSTEFIGLARSAPEGNELARVENLVLEHLLEFERKCPGPRPVLGANYYNGILLAWHAVLRGRLEAIDLDRLDSALVLEALAETHKHMARIGKSDLTAPYAARHLARPGAK